MSDKDNEKEIKFTDKRRVTLDSTQPTPKAEDHPPAVEEKKSDATPQNQGGDDGPAEYVGESDPKNAGPRPPVTFLSLIFSLASSAMIYLGDVADPEGKPMMDIDMAKQTIDLLGILAEKTKGNLTAEEEQFLSSTLRDLRLRFVQVRK